MRRLLLTAALIVTVPARLAAQGAEPPEPIRDNSFLVEEAYNQERGVVQHISTFARGRGGVWGYTFTQEWPLGGERHQLSGTVPLVGDHDGSGLGDVALNYRLQLAGPRGAVSVSPRLSLLLPTGDAEAGRGSGAAGVQVNLPVSWEAARALVLHTNVGGSLVPRARAPDGGRARAGDLLVAQSVIWLVRPRLNLMLEATHLEAHDAVTRGRTASTRTTTISPGVRWAYDFANGLQVVPGIAVPLEVGRADGERSLFLYLSFEHPFSR